MGCGLGPRDVVEPVQRLTPEQCRKQADELRQLARRVQDPEHSALLLLMAETWEQLAQSAGRGRGREREAGGRCNQIQLACRLLGARAPILTGKTAWWWQREQL